MQDRVLRQVPAAGGTSIPVTTIDKAPPHMLLEQRYSFQTTTLPNYDVSADGERFLMVKDESGSARLNVVLKWFEELKRLAPTK